MMNQFVHLPNDARYFVDENAARESLIKLKKDEEIADHENDILGYQNYRIGLRAIARSSDSRTIISTVLPNNVFCGNSLLVSENDLENEDLLLISSLLNSLVVDYYARQVVSANINMFYVILGYI